MDNITEDTVHNTDVPNLSCRKSHHPEHVKKDLTNRLNRIEGQIRGIKGMV